MGFQKPQIVDGRVLNCLPSPNQANDWRIDHALQAGFLRPLNSPPKAIDLREEWWEIANQGYNGSCVGWATADSLLRWHFVKAGRLAPNERLSVRYLWMAAKETDNIIGRPTTFLELSGTWIKAALDVAKNFGVVTEATLPFDSFYQGSTEEFYAKAAQRKITAYFNLGSDLDSWRLYLAQNGPLCVRLDIDKSFREAAENGGILNRYFPDTILGGHALAIVGYSSDKFIVRNSYSTDWGDKGFAYASENYCKDAFKEAYGVVL